MKLNPNIFLKISNRMLKRQIKKCLILEDFDLDSFLILVEKSYEESKENSNLNLHITTTFENEILERKKKLSLTLKKKNELIRILCHDFNNSVAILLGAVSKAFREPLGPGQFQLWKKVEKISNMQADMINHIREMEAIDSGKKEICLASIKLKDVLENTYFIFEKKMQDKGISLVAEPFDGELSILAEKNSLLNSVINNIISNSIKFSEPNAKIYLKSQVFNGNRVVVTIKDEGIGIPTDILEKLFDPAALTNRPGTLGEPGTGFGMPLAKKYMECYKGSIEVESQIKNENSEALGTTVILKFNRG